MISAAHSRGPIRHSHSTSPAKHSRGWKVYRSKGQIIPQWINKQNLSSIEIERTLFHHSSGKAYEIGIWTLGNHRNPQLLKQLRSQLLPNLKRALKQQRMTIGVTAIKAAMIVGGRLPLCKVVHQSLSKTIEYHACLSNQPKEELKAVYQAFEQQVKRKVDQIEEDIRHKEQAEKAYFDRHGYSEEQRWEALKRLNYQNKEMEKALGEITVTEIEDAQFPDPPTFSLPNDIQKVTAVKIYKMLFKHQTGNLYEVGVWAYPQQNALQTMAELCKDSPLNAAMEELRGSLAKDLSAALVLQHSPYASRSFIAAAKIGGLTPLNRATCGEVKLDAFVCRQPAKEVEEVNQSFEKQIKEAISKGTIASAIPALRLERYIRYRRETLIGSAPDTPLEGMMLWQDRLKETERLLEWSEEGSWLAKRDLKWLIEWESKY